MKDNSINYWSSIHYCENLCKIIYCNAEFLIMFYNNYNVVT